MEIAAGSPIPEGEVILTRGAIALETSRKARVVLEAPATFRFASSQRLVLSRGRMSAEIPPAAKGFTVETPSSEVIDIGTNFGVDVAAGGVSEVHVFKGEVLARAGRSADRHSLRQDQALTLKADRATPRDVRGTAFIQSDEFQRLAAGLRPGRVTGWARSLATLRSEPTLFALPDLAEVSGGSFRRVQGRWPGSTAIEFTQPGDFLPLPLEGTSDALTLAAWVRLDRVPHTINSLLHVDGWGRTGQVHWMVAENQRMRLAVYDVPRVNPPTEQRYPESERPVLAATGRWTHLAVVYDAPRRSVRFYLDGHLDNEVEVAMSVPVVLGPARVGNWNQVDRMFSGRLDELVVLGRALSDAEVQSLYRAGNPYGPVAESPIQSASRW
ncbi:LamG-like jellyroll fold domain-containing protein [Singulisphaera sp. PoT]|uniref:LamG-like jellyroll fold domain-containing protein n=1 Tax=Singulisphaera sp. PoT TaxID=3411797 RepID=UPI003BF4D0C0